MSPGATSCVGKQSRAKDGTDLRTSVSHFHPFWGEVQTHKFLRSQPPISGHPNTASQHAAHHPAPHPPATAPRTHAPSTLTSTRCTSQIRDSTATCAGPGSHCIFRNMNYTPGRRRHALTRSISLALAQSRAGSIHSGIRRRLPKQPPRHAISYPFLSCVASAKGSGRAACHTTQPLFAKRLT